jgi:sn-glycerol 3-phosphate transport system ATP-binding protein
MRPALASSNVSLLTRTEGRRLVTDASGRSVTAVELLGAERLIYGELGGEPLIVRADEAAGAPAVGATLQVRAPEARLHWFDASTGQRL